jgi:hypothetical protein
MYRVLYNFIGILSVAAVDGATRIHGFDSAAVTMSEWDYIEHHLDITSAASHAEADCLNPPTWCCSAFPTNRTSAQ